ncbi:MAG: hypothetical protein HHJ13_00050 [Phycicoccus sp.]|nr:hypothetical protein [Phycicoccus sp.]
MMTTVDDDLGDDAPTDLANPLLRPLEPVELDLLDAIWDPISRETAQWPVWDYVSRTLYKGPARVRDAGAILASLPIMPDPMAGSLFGRCYGLVWQSGNGPGVADDDHVGLTIAGFVRLSERHAPLRLLADSLSGIISSLAAAERDTVPDPRQVVRPNVPLTPFIRDLTTGTVSHSIPLPAQVVLDVLMREHAPLGVMLGAEPPVARPTMFLRPYGGLTGAEDYLERINFLSQRRQRPAPTRRGEELAQTLDYVSHVFAVHPAWPMGPLLGNLDLETAVTLAADVTTQVEFSHRLSALATVLSGLRVPKPDQEALQRHHLDSKAGPLIRLSVWLEDFIQDDGGRQRALGAVEDIRSANDLRVLAQHGGTKPRTRATQACSRLGIEDPIRNWGQAWETVRARVADAFDVVRQEMTAQPERND